MGTPGALRRDGVESILPVVIEQTIEQTAKGPTPPVGGWRGRTASRILLSWNPLFVSKPSQLFLECALVLLLSAWPLCVRAQAPAGAPQQGMSGGVNTGGTFAPVLDAQKR